MQTQERSPVRAAILVALVGSLAAGQAAAQRTQGTQGTDRVSIPEGTIVRLELSERVNSRTAERGAAVRARLDAADRSGFPSGTEFEGVISQVERVSRDRPGTLDMEFRRVVLPSGSTETITGNLASLAAENVRAAADGRLESRRRSAEPDWKWVGANSGPVLADATAQETPRGDLLGTLFGILNRDRARGFREVELERGAKFGVRLEQAVAFYTRPDFRFVNDTERPRDRGFSDRGGLDRRVPDRGVPDRDNPSRIPRDRVGGPGSENRFESVDVYVDGTLVRFGERKPTRVNNVLYIPLRPMAEAGKWELRQVRRSNDFSLLLPDGELRGTAGQMSVTHDGQRLELQAAPMLLNGEVYVPMEFFTRGADLRADWNRADHRLDLKSSGTDRERITTLEGEVVSLDEDLGIVTVLGPGQRRYRVQTDEATIRLRGRRVDLIDLRVGDRVTIEGWTRTR